MLTRFPALTQKEFNEACQTLQRRCEDSIDGTRWLGVKWQSDTLFIRTQCLSRKPHLLQHVQQDGEQASNVDNHADVEDEVDAVDQGTLEPARRAPDTIIVDYSITLSPTYQVPVLWFTIAQPTATTSKGVDVVYDHLVSNTSRPALQQVGIMGGISMANHPVLEVPAYFVHPCNSADALQEVVPNHPIKPEEYLIFWLGLTGSCVGLHVPSKLLSETDNIPQ